MALVPPGLLPLAAFGLIVVGTAVVAFSRAPKAYSLALLALGVFFVQGLAPDFLFRSLALRTTDLPGEWWTPLTYMYLHAPGLVHLLGNLIILVTAGPALEDRVGSRWFLGVYFLAGFAAAGAHVALTTLDVVRDLPAVGASGAIFGVLTAFAVRYPRERLPVILGFFIVSLPAFVVLLIHLGINLVYMLGDTAVAWYGHFAGYLVGLAAALVMERRRVAAPPVVPGERVALPDLEKLRPLATTPALREMLDKAAKFRGEHAGDAEFANAWVDRFLEKARCPAHAAPLHRDAFTAYCPHGDYSVDFLAKRA